MNLAVLGLQWGDEGKGKAIDYLAPKFDVVVRYQGGHNAGHTIYYKGQKVVLHLLPSGVFSDGAVNVIGHGVVVNPVELVKEIREARTAGANLERLELSALAPLILPEHQQLDIVFEDSRYIKIGTTRRGIGPAYEDQVGRRAVTIRDLLDRETFREKLNNLNALYNKLITVSGGEQIAIDSYIDAYLEAGEFLGPFVKNTVYSLHEYQRQGKRLLFEGAQGVLLDINFGTYPFVTSSNPTVGGICTGTGVSHKDIHKVVGISKAYATRVGGGPFPSELTGAAGDRLRELGNEYGATTGRPRRVGWLDLVALKYAIMINGVDEIFLTKLDVLDEFDHINAVIAYDINGNESDRFEPGFEYLNRATPRLKTFPGWKTPVSGVRDFQSLPAAAREYIAFIEQYAGIPVGCVSVGPNREQTIGR